MSNFKTVKITQATPGGPLQQQLIDSSMSGGLSKIAEVILGSNQLTISFGSIPSSYRHLKLVVVGRTDDGNPDFYIQYNGDTSANYDVGGGFVGFSSGNLTAVAVAQASIGSVASSTASAGQAGTSDITIGDYARTTWWKTAVGHTARTDNVTQPYYAMYGQTWRSTAAITSIVLGKTTGGGNFVTGTIATLYGVG